jgi:hypothetical protein
MSAQVIDLHDGPRDLSRAIRDLDRGCYRDAEAAAWAHVAEAAERALGVPGLVAAGRDEMRRLINASWRCAGGKPGA